MAPHERDKPFWYLRRSAARVQAEIDEEIEGHLQMRIEELQARGIPPDDARREAVRRFATSRSREDTAGTRTSKGRRPCNEP